ncbi:MAG: cation diffusion facilitator family transporter [Armatimonadota bacterium]|nr:cation diffusion facilitator family transporter [Armatimonadota bacterium]
MDKTGAARLSIISNVLLVLAKGAIGIIGGSMSILAEAVHSAVDLIAAVIAYIAVLFADRPADEAHAYGHGKFENLSGTVEALLIIVAGAYIVYESIERIITNAPVERLDLGMVIMLVSAVANFLVSANLFRVAKQTDSIALEADGHHLRLDVYTSLGVLFGLILVHLTNFVILDRLIGLCVALWIGWIGIQLSRKAIGPLMDSQLPAAEMERIVEIINSEPRILDFHKLRTRKAGAQRHIDVHLLMPRDMSLTTAHELAEEVEDKIRSELENVTIVTHVEPAEEDSNA